MLNSRRVFVHISEIIVMHLFSLVRKGLHQSLECHDTCLGILGSKENFHNLFTELISGIKPHSSEYNTIIDLVMTV